jgi:hypothetical protein
MYNDITHNYREFEGMTYNRRQRCILINNQIKKNLCGQFLAPQNKYQWSIQNLGDLY